MSFKMVPFDSLRTVSYSHFVTTMPDTVHERDRHDTARVVRVYA